MTTTEMIKTLATRLKITQREARRHLRNLFTAISERLQEGESVRLRGFGTLGTTENTTPRTYDASLKEFVPPPEKIKIFFRPYRRLTDLVKERRPS
ncbi:MAG: HU family DNA-binding protein [candidate division KSB1 bacterium]|nr:HU family DNA-binding protein [candidate division KSB1 bacterium]MDZ7301472.1 HU family DNA-binding protein [candidate division KSB1 bacterium]MDZ7310874.1 HU family DNA-binding protein [candidate division KSB1 bacterium]